MEDPKRIKTGKAQNIKKTVRQKSAEPISPVTTKEELADRRSAIEWIILNQFGRRNLPAHERARLALRLKPVIAEKAKENQYSGVNQYTESLSQNSVKPSARIDTQKELAKIAGVSHDTIAKVEKIEKSAPEPTACRWERLHLPHGRYRDQSRAHRRELPSH